MYEIPELLLVNMGCDDALTGVRVSDNIVGNETELALSTYEDPEGFVADKPYLVQEIAPYKVALTTIKINSACKEQSRIVQVELLFKAYLPWGLEDSHDLRAILDVSDVIEHLRCNCV
jgi:hypothetical protein